MREIEDINSGKMEGQQKTVVEQKYHLLEQRLALLPKLADQIAKNYDRVVKSVPPEVINGMVGKTEKARLDKTFAEVNKNMTYAESVFKSATKAYEDKHLV